MGDWWLRRWRALAGVIAALAVAAGLAPPLLGSGGPSGLDRAALPATTSPTVAPSEAAQPLTAVPEAAPLPDEQRPEAPATTVARPVAEGPAVGAGAGATSASADDATSRAPTAGPTGRIAFWTHGVNSMEIYVVGARGSRPHHVGQGTTPRWSPDGARLAFADHYGLQKPPAVYVSKWDGTERTRVAELGLEPAWSPDGTRLAYRTLVPDPTRPTTYYGPPFVGPPGMQGDISVVRLDDNWVTTVTTGPGDDHSPSWSPDGSRLAFARSGQGGGTVHSVAAGGGDEKAHSPEPAQWVTRVAWSPAGARIAVAEQGINQGRVWVTDAEGNRVIPLHTGKPEVYSLAWSPDGKSIAFTTAPAAEGETERIHVVELGGSSRAVLEGYDATFSPDGRYLAYCSGGALWRAERDGANPVRLTDKIGCQDPHWGR